MSALLQVFLALAPVDAIASDTGFENPAATSHVVASGTSGFVLSGSDPVTDTLERAFEPGEFLVATRQPELPAPQQSLLFATDSPAPAEAHDHFYRGRAPPFSSLS